MMSGSCLRRGLDLDLVGDAAEALVACEIL
jgi:hypothetical protein